MSSVYAGDVECVCHVAAATFAVVVMCAVGQEQDSEKESVSLLVEVAVSFGIFRPPRPVTRASTR